MQLFAWLPLWAVHAIAGFLGYCMYFFPTQTRRVTQINLRLCFPTMGEAERNTLLKESLRNTASTALEMGKAWLLPMEKTLELVVEAEGKELLSEAIAEGKGVIVLAPHLGNWEILGFYITGISVPTFLYQPPKIELIDSMIRKARTRGGLKVAPTSRKGIAALLSALRRSEVIAVLPDQVPDRQGGAYAPFFGKQALTMTLISNLVARTGARVVCGFAKRLPGSRGFKIVLKSADQLMYSSNLGKSVEGLNRSVEQCVEEACSQYQWEYKRFKHLPDDERIY